MISASESGDCIAALQRDDAMKTIIWDVDDVLNDLMRWWLELAWLPAHPACRVTYPGLTENPPHALLGIGLEEYLASLDAFRLSPAAREMAPVPEVLEWFTRHGARARHVALTAAPQHTVHESAAWVLRHFGGWIRTFAFVPSPRPGASSPGYEATKEEYLAGCGRVDVFLDDNPAHVQAARRRGMAALLVPRPWNAGGPTLAQTLEQLAHLVAADEGLPVTDEVSVP